MVFDLIEQCLRSTARFGEFPKLQKHFAEVTLRIPAFAVETKLGVNFYRLANALKGLLNVSLLFVERCKVHVSDRSP